MYRCYFKKRLTQEHPSLSNDVFRFGKSLYKSPEVKQEWSSYIACMCVAEDVLLGKSSYHFYTSVVKEETLWKKINEVLGIDTLTLSNQHSKDGFFVEGNTAVKKISNPKPRELYFGRALDNTTGIISLKGSLYHNNKLFVGMELAAMDLFGYIYISIDNNTLINMNLFVDILEAIALMHDNDIVHGDIKPENILIMPDGTAKVCDFDTCFFVGTLKTAAVGTPPYMAYEMLKAYPVKKDYGKEIDIWSLGCVYMCMKKKVIPYFEDTSDQEFDAKSMTKRCEIITEDIEKKSCNFVVSMLNTTPQFRPTADQLLKVYRRT